MRVPTAIVLLFLVHILYGIPVPRPNKVEDPNVLRMHQDHQIDNVNEVHRDVQVKEAPPYLTVDKLPEDSNQAKHKEVVAGGRVAVQESQQQHPQALGDLAVAPPKAQDKKPLEFDSEMLEKIKANKLPIEQLKPVDHMDGVRLEQDGHVNHEFHKEMFLGQAHEEFKMETVEDAETKLMEIVDKVDTNKDKRLDAAEMEEWIRGNMKEHFQTARDENDHIFKHLDPDGDGLVDWKEYYVHFLLSRGFDIDNALKHVKDYDESVELEQIDKDQLISYKFRWTDADVSPTDNQLSKSEFMVFRHPEHSERSLQLMVENVLRGVDTDNNGYITMEEFAALPPGEVEGKEYEDMDKQWQEDRKKEFTDFMDMNHDGKVDTAELKSYLDPTNPIQAQLEANSLLSMMDEDKDKKLSMDEIQKHLEVFLYSKVVNFAANVHDEF